MPSDFLAAFADLREILRRHAEGMIVQSDTPTDFTLITPAIGPNKKPIWFGCVLLKKSAVTYHLMPLYMNPALARSIPPELLARKQGKTCFNFQRPDPDLFAKLDALTGAARAAFARGGFLTPGPITTERIEAAVGAAGGDADAVARARKAKGHDAVNGLRRSLHNAPSPGYHPARDTADEHHGRGLAAGRRHRVRADGAAARTRLLATARRETRRRLRRFS